MNEKTNVSAGADEEAQSEFAEVLTIVVAYSFCSASMLMVNKLTMSVLPLPSTVTVIQLLCSCGFVLIGKKLGYLRADSLDWDKAKPYIIYVLAFALGMYSSMRSLEESNVETIIVFRACSPLVVSIADWWFMEHEFPSARSFLGLLLIVVGAIGYGCNDETFWSIGWSAYFWPSLYLGLICFQMTFGKQLLNSVQMSTFWGPVLYTNTMSLLPLGFVAVSTEASRLPNIDESTVLTALPFLLLSCIAGTGISYTGWACRGAISATSFTVVGVVNKCLTLAVNLMIMPKHSNVAGLASLMISLLGGAIYRQSPKKTIETSSMGS